jgi:hypothetical protein
MNENQKNRMATIIAGLAATGHYTYLKEVDTGKRLGGEIVFKDEPFLRSIPWDKESELSRYDIIEAALALLQELEKIEI